MMLGALILLQAATPAPTPTPTPTPAPPPPGTWTLADRVNPGGVHSVSASVVAKDGLSRLVVKCDIGQEPVVSVQFLQPNPFGASADKPVSVSFDGGMAYVDDWRFPGSGAYVIDTAAVTRLTTALVKAKEVAVDTTNASNFAVQARFAAPRGDAMIRKVLGVCGYTLGTVPPLPEEKKP